MPLCTVHLQFIGFNKSYPDFLPVSFVELNININININWNFLCQTESSTLYLLCTVQFLQNTEYKLSTFETRKNELRCDILKYFIVGTKGKTSEFQVIFYGKQGYIF